MVFAILTMIAIGVTAVVVIANRLLAYVSRKINNRPYKSPGDAHGGYVPDTSASDTAIYTMMATSYVSDSACDTSSCDTGSCDSGSAGCD